MRYCLGILLAAGLFLIALWTSASVFFAWSQADLPSKTVKWVQSAEAPSFVGASLAHLNTSLKLNPTASASWLARSSLLQFYGHLLPEAWRDVSWEQDMVAAMIRSPAHVVPLFKLALACAKGYSQLASGSAQCEQLFLALVSRDPQYGYVRFRYADYLYTRALVDPGRKRELAVRLCQQYGLALNSMDSTRLLHAWHEKRAYYNCLNLADSYPVARSLGPSSARQWGLLGVGLGRKSEEFWDQAQPAVLNDLQANGSPLANYTALAHGLGKVKRYKRGARVLRAYVSRHPEDARGWEALARYLDKNIKWFTNSTLVNALLEAERKAKLQLSSGLYFLGKSCQLKEQSLAESFFQKILCLEPNNSKIYASMAHCLMGLGQKQEAIIYYQKALNLDPNSYTLHVELGRAYASSREYNRAIDEFQKALDLNPNDHRAKQEIRRMGIYE
jgi:tetratricopeptide (TPR) repeat protein